MPGRPSACNHHPTSRFLRLRCRPAERRRRPSGASPYEAGRQRRASKGVDATSPPPGALSTDGHESAVRPGFDPAGFNRLVDEMDDEAILDKADARRDHSEVDLLLYAVISGFPHH